MAASAQVLLVEARESLELVTPVFESSLRRLLPNNAKSEVEGARC